MHISPILRLTYALRGANAADAIAQLHGSTELAAIDGLLEVIYFSTSSTLIVSAIQTLSECQSEVVIDALGHALGSPFPSVRSGAIESLRKRRCDRFADAVGRILRGDGHWTVQSAALQALAESSEPTWWLILYASADPHWRVRHALIQSLFKRGEILGNRNLIEQKLTQLSANARVEGIREYLRYRWQGGIPELILQRRVDQQTQRPSFWDPDSAVLARNLKDLVEKDPVMVLSYVPMLFADGNDNIRRLIGDLLRTSAGPEHLAMAIDQLDEPRLGLGEEIARLVARLDLDRIEATARLILHRKDRNPAALGWAIDQAEVSFPTVEEEQVLEGLLCNAARQSPIIRAALARLAGRLLRPLDGHLADTDADVRLAALRSFGQHAPKIHAEKLERLAMDADPRIRAQAALALIQNGAAALVELLASDGDARVRLRLAEGLAVHGVRSPVRDRLQTDGHPLVRAAALTPERAAELAEHPERESSWHVLAQAARIRKKPIWRLEPKEPWQPPRFGATCAEPLVVQPILSNRAKPIAKDGPLISPMAISGHYGLPVEGFVAAANAGVNLFFWEPSYGTLTEFATRLSPMQRQQLHFLAGTFEAEPERIAKDVDRALRSLGVERVSILLLFWVQSWSRVTADVRETLERLRTTGKIDRYGLSTHSRPLAVEAIEADWNPVMVRHSGAYRGAEERVFPAALQHGASILTFNNTCYGRLLKGPEAPDAANCYRYSLTQPGVIACVSAPATLEQLKQNLSALHEPDLLPERRADLLRHGEAIAISVCDKQSTESHLLQLADRLLKDVAKHIDIDFVAEIIGPNRVKELGPRVVELQVVYGGIVAKQAAVVAVLQVQRLVTFVDCMEEFQKALPPWVRHFREWWDLLICGRDALFGQQLAVFAKGDKDDAVEDLLRDVNGFIERPAELALQMVNERDAIVAVFLVEIVADFALPSRRHLKHR